MKASWAVSFLLGRRPKRLAAMAMSASPCEHCRADEDVAVQCGQERQRTAAAAGEPAEDDR